MQQELWIGVAIALLVALVAGLGEHRRRKRIDMDRIGLISWPLVQVLALLMAVMLASIAIH